MKGREIYLDYIKLIAISLVLVYHCNVIQSPISDALLSCCVPLFFLVNGYLMLRKERDEMFMIAKALKLFILFWGWGCLSTLCQLIVVEESFSVKSLVLHIYNLDLGYITHLWFIQTLFILYVIYPLLKSYINGATNQKLLCLIIFVGFCSLQFVSVFMRKINPVAGWHGYSLLYFLLGYFVLVSAKNRFDKVKTYWYCTVFIFAWFFQTVLNMYIPHMDYTLRVAFSAEQLVFGGYRSVFVVLMVVSLVILLSRTPMRQYKFIIFAGKNTLGIYFLHDVVIKLLHVFFPKVSDLGVCYPILLLIICCILCAILNKSRIGRYLIHI